MTAQTLAPPTGRAVLAELARVLERADLDVPVEQLGSVLDDVARALTRARALVRRAKVRAVKTQPAADPQRPPDDSGGRGTTTPAAAPTARAEQHQATGRVSLVRGESPAGKPATATPALAMPRSGSDVHSLAGSPGSSSRSARGAAAPSPEPRSAAHSSDPLARPAAASEGTAHVGAPAKDSAGRPTPRAAAERTRSAAVGRVRAVLAGLAELVVLVLALAAALLGASTTGQLAPDDVVPATAVGAALVAGLLAGRVTAPAVAALITRRCRRAQTVAPTRAAT